ncbi:protein phosphatase CheZ [Acuticoccus sp. M5D2P5]|uniref:protein phosphatase CheZ n=1 Tax=Acuticoccus kalidii TaxID=2910977 RepID=UPI001F1E04E6|nr:protein phosphatase CheZ [Acuticoccus kalidii]MCF3932454.1 protein phosphatase CheZ [Acuticoccus kalidii]
MKARRFRVEISEAKRLAESSPMTQQVDYILQELHTMRAKGSDNEPVTTAIAMWSGVEDIQKRIDVTKTEISALQARGADDVCKNRTAEELRAVVSGTEMATDQILAAAETIDGIVQPLLTCKDETTRKNASEVADCVLQIFEACNFQDITGQRITKVLDSLQFIEQRIATMIDVWRTTQEHHDTEKKEKTDRDLLNGPALETDHGVVSQDDVDALFS